VDLRQQVVMLDGETIRLTRMQYRLLALLVKHPGVVVTRLILLMQIWGMRLRRSVCAEWMYTSTACGKNLGNTQTSTSKQVYGDGYRFRPMPGP
jgi:two-component system KDP operon response regulator KdpE